jgi:hypothetical protein
MNTYVNLRSHLAAFFSEWGVFQIKFSEKIKTHILRSIPKTVAFMA